MGVSLFDAANVARPSTGSSSPEGTDGAVNNVSNFNIPGPAQIKCTRSKEWPTESGQAVIITMEDLYNNEPSNAFLATSVNNGDYIIMVDEHNNGNDSTDQRVFDKACKGELTGDNLYQDGSPVCFGGPFAGTESIASKSGNKIYWFEYCTKVGTLQSDNEFAWNRFATSDDEVILIHR